MGGEGEWKFEIFNQEEQPTCKDRRKEEEESRDNQNNYQDKDVIGCYNDCSLNPDGMTRNNQTIQIL